LAPNPYYYTLPKCAGFETIITDNFGDLNDIMKYLILDTMPLPGTNS